MARWIVTILFVQASLTKVLTQSQPSITQYLQLAGLSNYIPQNAPPAQYPSQRPAEVTRTPSNVPILPQKPLLTKDATSTTVLNNLAIALQLLIVNNILSSPCDPFAKLEKMEPSVPYVELPKPAKYYEGSPNSNFLGTSSFVDPTALSGIAVRPNARANLALMSPYEALLPSSPYSDPILSTVYAPSYSKKDFQSPYAAILSADGNRDLFSMTDLF